MPPTYIEIGKVIKTIEKLNLKERDLLIFKVSDDDVTFEAIEQARADIKEKIKWNGFIVILRQGEELYKLPEQTERDLLKALKHKYQEESNV